MGTAVIEIHKIMDDKEKCGWRHFCLSLYFYSPTLYLGYYEAKRLFSLNIYFLNFILDILIHGYIISEQAVLFKVEQEN